jgi:hypothetical protein
VVAQLDLQVTRLQEARCKRQQQLENFKHPTTIDDIIENESE